MIRDPVPTEAWAAEGARVAGALDDVAAAVVIGSEPRAAVAVALGIARSLGDRRAGIGDLVGGLAPLTLRDGAPGLLECFRDGVPVSEIARPLSKDGALHALPSGDGPIAERWVMESARWHRLVAGFREVDALLLLVARPGTPGLATLIEEMDGVIAVDLAPAVTRAWPLLATVDRPEPELPPITATRTPAPVSRGASRRGRRAVLLVGAGIVALLALALVIGIGPRTRGEGVTEGVTEGGADGPGSATASTANATPVSADTRLLATDTITLGPIVNPEDENAAANFAVELVAANTLAGANSRLEMRGAALPAPTLAPVPLGSDGRPWYRALAGAWRDRDDAQAWLDALRDRGLVRHEMGRVLRVPLALRLAVGVRPADAPAAIATWSTRGVPAYALQQDDGSVRLYAGAFETSGQSVLLAKSLRDLGVTPVLAFRTGRTF